ncbi:hypothetical protein II906_06830 [bacterium]|nr:hypothetical protein [bacterium]
MVYKSLKIKDLIKGRDCKITDIPLLKGTNADLRLFNLKKNEQTDIYNAVNNVCIYVDEGEIEVRFKENDCGCSVCGCSVNPKDDEEGITEIIKNGQLLLFERGMIYWMKSFKDSVFFVTRM